jgi:micrococcal nuclease
MVVSGRINARQLTSARRAARTRALSAGACALALVACGGGDSAPQTKAQTKAQSKAQTTARAASVDTAIIVEVIDGDTVTLEVAGHTETVRLVGIDTPETVHPTKPVECFGPQASAFLARLLPPGTPVRIRRDTQARDSYGRLLLYLFLPAPDGDKFVNLELVARGYAVPLSIEPNTRWRAAFVDAAFDAQRNSRGLWGVCK